MINKKINLIIIDDSQVFRTALRFMFDLNTDFNVTIYKNGFDFIKNWSSHSSGFILMDLLMPKMSAIDLLEEFAKVSHQFYIIAMSGHADTLTAKKMKDLGAQEFLSKPFDVDSLLKRIRALHQQQLIKS